MEQPTNIFRPFWLMLYVFTLLFGDTVSAYYPCVHNDKMHEIIVCRDWNDVKNEIFKLPKASSKLALIDYDDTIVGANGMFPGAAAGIEALHNAGFDNFILTRGHPILHKKRLEMLTKNNVMKYIDCVKKHLDLPNAEGFIYCEEADAPQYHNPFIKGVVINAILNIMLPDYYKTVGYVVVVDDLVSNLCSIAEACHKHGIPCYSILIHKPRNSLQTKYLSWLGSLNKELFDCDDNLCRTIQCIHDNLNTYKTKKSSSCSKLRVFIDNSNNKEFLKAAFFEKEYLKCHNTSGNNISNSSNNELFTETQKLLEKLEKDCNNMSHCLDKALSSNLSAFATDWLNWETHLPSLKKFLYIILQQMNELNDIFNNPPYTSLSSSSSLLWTSISKVPPPASSSSFLLPYFTHK
jgi:hypothetical protein